MISMMCGVWQDFKNWVTIEWSQTTFIIVICVLAVCGLFMFLSFFKKSFDKGKRPKWFQLILSLILFGMMAVVFSARFA